MQSATQSVRNRSNFPMGNSARSIPAESILRKNGGERFNAYSAGSHPKGRVNPLALKTLEAYEYPVEGFRSKSWEEFTAPAAVEGTYPRRPCRNHWGAVASFACPAECNFSSWDTLSVGSAEDELACSAKEKLKFRPTYMASSTARWVRARAGSSSS
jgi:hypothetical protein